MKKMRSTLALVLCLSALFSLAACAKKPAPPATSTPAASTPAASTPAPAQSTGTNKPDGYPEDTVSMIVSYGAGGGSDLLARAMASAIDLDGETMVCTNITGGSGTIGMMECFNADPDGYTMCLALPESYTVQILNGSVQKDLFDKLIMVACPVYDVDSLSVKADSKFKSLQELIDYAKAHPGEVTMAGVGSGLNKLMAIDFMQKAGVTFKYIPYEDSNATRAAVLGNQADVLFSQACESKPYHDSGEMNVLAIASEERCTFMADVPTCTELGVEFVAGIHRGFAVTPGTPDEIVDYLEQQLRTAYENPEFQKNLQDNLGYNTAWLGHDDYTALAKSLPDQYAELIKVAGNY